MRALNTDSNRIVPGRSRREQGLTLVELLVVIAIIALLATMLLPAMAKTKARAQGLKCLSNTRQLTLGWLMYADDHEGQLCPNGIGPRQGWVEGVLSFDNTDTDNTNTLYLVDPQYAKLAPYVPSAEVYRCPLDRSLFLSSPNRYSRVRSLAMNEAVGCNTQGEDLPYSVGWSTYHKISDINAPTPSDLWVLIEQHPDSINDGRFAIDCQAKGKLAHWVDFPANFHDRACSISFADGHSELHTWVDPITLQPNRYCGCLAHFAAERYFITCPDSPDMAWLQARTSAKRF